ncbi:MAG: tRNA pseudouridine(13) synthase TruD [Zavarzinella sp.]
MKLRQFTEDFIVEEIPRILPSSGGYCFYKLTKRGWTTHDALDGIRRRWKIDQRRLSYGGLKDRHAQTVQYFTIDRGPASNLKFQTVDVEFMGYVSRHFQSSDILANRFDLVLRSMSEEEINVATTALEQIQHAGIPNYFDDQRFGSLGTDGRFIAKEMILERFDEALKLALAGEYAHDRAAAKQEKALLLEHWGDWPTLKAKLPKGHARSLITYLCDHPTDFKGACKRLRPDLRSLYLSAYQSYLWNKILEKWLRNHLPAEDLGDFTLKSGQHVFPTRVPTELKETWQHLRLPLPSARLKPPPDAPWLEILSQVMLDEGLPLDQMRIKGMQEPFFSKGERPACIWAENLTWEHAKDDKNPGKELLKLSFQLPAGCYATMLVKRLTN